MRSHRPLGDGSASFAATAMIVIGGVQTSLVSLARSDAERGGGSNERHGRRA